MNVTIYWAEDGEQYGFMHVYSSDLDSASGMKDVRRVGWRRAVNGLYGLAVERYDFRADVYTDEVDDEGDPVCVESDGVTVMDNWMPEVHLAPHEAASYEEYMRWADANIDVVTVDGNVFFRSSRLAD